MSEPADEEGTDPNIAMPSGPPTEEIALPAPEEEDEAPPIATAPSPPPLPSSRVPARPPFDRPFPTSRPGSTRPGPMPPRATTPSSRPAPSAPPRAAAPPSSPPRPTAPKPSSVSPLPSRAAERPPERQRFAQMQTQLDEARSSLARQRHELDELRTQLDAKESKIEAMLSELREGDGRDAIEARLRELDERGDRFAEELRARIERAGDRGEELTALELRVRQLEEGAELTRVRMRLELTGRQVKEAVARLEAVENAMGDLGARLSTHVATQKRLERLESLFQELADETREHRDATDLDELRARLSDVEALTLETGSGLRDQQATLRTLRESIKPPPIAPGSGDDLTRIKGIGPKYARLLAQIGVTTIAQVAAWSDADLEVAAIELSINPARIRKAGWIDNAKALLAG